MGEASHGACGDLWCSQREPVRPWGCRCPGSRRLLFGVGCLAVLTLVGVLPTCCPRAVRGASDTSIRAAVRRQRFDLQVPDAAWFAPTLPPLPNAPFPSWEPPADTQRRGRGSEGSSSDSRTAARPLSYGPGSLGGCILSRGCMSLVRKMWSESVGGATHPPEPF